MFVEVLDKCQGRRIQKVNGSVQPAPKTQLSGTGAFSRQALMLTSRAVHKVEMSWRGQLVSLPASHSCGYELILGRCSVESNTLVHFHCFSIANNLLDTT